MCVFGIPVVDMVLHVIGSWGGPEHEGIGLQIGILSYSIDDIKAESVHAFIQIISYLIKNSVPTDLIISRKENSLSKRIQN